MIKLTKIEGGLVNNDNQDNVQKTNETSGLDKVKTKKNKEPIDRQDLLCYIGAFLFLLLGILPLLIRNLDPNYNPNKFDDDDETPIVNTTKTNIMRCNRTMSEEGYSYNTEIVNSYRNNYIMNSDINYIVTIDPNTTLTFENIEIPEFVTISSIESKGIGYSVNDQTYTVRIDYSLDPPLRENELLGSHNQVLDVQRTSYEELGYSCVVE